jgi:lysophospholipase L1-like esterase
VAVRALSLAVWLAAAGGAPGGPGAPAVAPAVAYLPAVAYDDRPVPLSLRVRNGSGRPVPVRLRIEAADADGRVTWQNERNGAVPADRPWEVEAAVPMPGDERRLGRVTVTAQPAGGAEAAVRVLFASPRDDLAGLAPRAGLLCDPGGVPVCVLIERHVKSDSRRWIWIKGMHRSVTRRKDILSRVSVYGERLRPGTEKRSYLDMLDEACPGRTVRGVALDAGRHQGPPSVLDALCRFQTALAASPPDWAILFLGTNDLACGTPVNRYRSCLELMAQQLAARGVRRLTLVPPVGSPAVAPRLKAYRAAVADVARNYEADLLDIGAKLSRADWMPLEKQPRVLGRYPTTAGHVRLARALADHIR